MVGLLEKVELKSWYGTFIATDLSSLHILKQIVEKIEQDYINAENEEDNDD